jgi:hypothetical protein
MRKINKCDLSRLIAAFLAAIMTSGVQAENKYYTFEGQITSFTDRYPYWLTTYSGLYVGYAVKYVVMIDQEREATQTLSTGEVVVYSDIDESYPSPDCTDGICDDWTHYFHGDHIWGDHTGYSDDTLPTVLEFNSAKNRYMERVLSDDYISSSVVLASESNTKEIICHDKFLEQWTEGDVCSGLEYIRDTDYEGEPYFAVAYSSLTLVDVSTVSPVATVAIDVEPRTTSNIVKLQKGPPLKVAIMSDDSFDATQINHSRIYFGPSWQAPYRVAEKDVNRDGYTDLLTQYNVGFTWIQCGDTNVTLTAETVDGQIVSGTDLISTAKCE